MNKKVAESLRRGAAWLRANPLLGRAIPGSLSQLIRHRFYTVEYVAHLAGQDAAAKDWPAESDYPTEHPWRVGVITDPMYCHLPYVAACRDLKVAYRKVNLFGSDWLDEIQRAKCDAFVAWPGEFISEWKRLYDDRLRFLTQELRKMLYPPYEALWLYGSKERQRDWLQFHGFPHATSWVFYDRDEALSFLDSHSLPLVAKLDIGASASGVWVVENLAEARKLVLKAFEKGLSARRSLRHARQWRHILFQEYLPGVREWRIIRIGDTYLGHEKGKAGQFHSGSWVVGWHRPPNEALDLIHAVTERGDFRSMNMDVFQTTDGRFLINELQSVFGAVDTAQMYIDGVPGRFRRLAGRYVFEEGRFCSNACCTLRMQDLLGLLEAGERHGNTKGQL